MAYQKDEKVCLRLNVAIEGTFVDYDETKSNAWILLKNEKKPISVPIEAICNGDVVPDGSQEIKFSEESKQSIKRQLELINYSFRK